MRIIHIADFHTGKCGTDLYATDRKIPVGLTRTGHVEHRPFSTCAAFQLSGFAAHTVAGKASGHLAAHPRTDRETP